MTTKLGNIDVLTSTCKELAIFFTRCWGTLQVKHDERPR